MLLAIALLAFGGDPVITLSHSLADEPGGGSELVGLFASASADKLRLPSRRQCGVMRCLHTW